MRLWPFGSRNSKRSLPIPAEAIEGAIEELELCRLNDLAGAIDLAIKKAFSLNDFQVAQFGDTGGYFGSEFDIYASAGRMKQLYAREPWTFATAALIARTIGSIPFDIIDSVTKEKIEDHPLAALINNGNDWQSNEEMRWNGVVDLILGGNMFAVFDEGYTKMYVIPVEYVRLRFKGQAEASLDLEDDGPIAGIDITGGQLEKRFFDWKHVVQIRFPNPFNPFYGMSMYMAAARPILLDRYKNEFEQAFYLRGATNAGVVETTEDISKTRMERLMRTFEQAFTGKRNWWRTLFLPKGAKWVNSGLSMAEMQHLEGLRENRRTLLAVLGIPPMKVGIVEDVNRSTSEVQEQTYYENTVIPLANFIAAGWNNSFIIKRMYGATIKVVPCWDGIEAIEGSLEARADRANKLDKILVINELRELVGYGPLKASDPRGNMFVAEIKPQIASPFGGTPAPPPPESLGPEPEEEAEPEVEPEEQELSISISRVKRSASDSQEKIETSHVRQFLRAFDGYVDLLITQAEFGIRDERNLRSFLQNEQADRLEFYVKNIGPILGDAMERGFVSGMANTKRLSDAHMKAIKDAKRQTRFSEIDEQAVDILREKTRDEKRRVLLDRNIRTFKGFDETRTELIMDIVEKSAGDGRSAEEIAETIRADYNERYRDQAFTVGRTEVLGAVSVGWSWNHETLGQVFSEVNKQWFHIGDIGINPDARLQHGEFEKAGVVPSSYKWMNPETGGVLAYPRDFEGGAADVINCRCVSVSVIPPTAQSNAEAILETE